MSGLAVHRAIGLADAHADEASRLRELLREEREKVEALRQALRRHGAHDADCSVSSGSCTCGLEAALAPTP